jgi:2-succinyl-5-enolpyruvyl-6-hydroxy-3-cyclohexene-1-carboxylate synthase
MARAGQEKRTHTSVGQAGSTIAPPNINIFTAATLVRLLVRVGVKQFVLSPGSRSTPLAVALADELFAPHIVCTDERAAAFYAAGFIRATGSPAAVISTSGTAVANFFPGVVEAFQSRLPLILLTADRPDQLQDCGANQTIDQRDIYGKYVCSSALVPESIDATNVVDVLTDCYETLRRATGLSEPAHINCRFHEPLAPVPEPFESARLDDLANRFFEDLQPSIPERGAVAGGGRELDASVDSIKKAKRGLILSGPRHAWKVSGKIADLARVTGWPMVADVLSQDRFSAQTETGTCALYDLFLDGEPSGGLSGPDLVLHFGGLPTSKRLQQYLARHRGVEYIKIQDHTRCIDPDRLETERIAGDIDRIAGRLGDAIGNTTGGAWARSFSKLERASGRYLQHYFRDGRLGEPATAYFTGVWLDNNDALFLSNSMPVRDADSFMPARTGQIPVGANRGASGIDGVIASACGFAAGCRRRTTLLIGDLAFLHDLGSLALAASAEYPVLIVVFNNNGGGIFSFLPISGYPDVFEKYFGTPHGLEFRPAAEMFGLPWYSATSVDEYKTAYTDAVAGCSSAVIEIRTNRGDNRQDHDSLREGLSSILSSGLEKD